MPPAKPSAPASKPLSGSKAMPYKAKVGDKPMARRRAEIPRINFSGKRGTSMATQVNPKASTVNMAAWSAKWTGGGVTDVGGNNLIES